MSRGHEIKNLRVVLFKKYLKHMSSSSHRIFYMSATDKKNTPKTSTVTKTINSTIKIFLHVLMFYKTNTVDSKLYWLRVLTWWTKRLGRRFLVSVYRDRTKAFCFCHLVRIRRPLDSLPDLQFFLTTNLSVFLHFLSILNQFLVEEIVMLNM